MPYGIKKKGSMSLNLAIALGCLDTDHGVVNKSVMEVYLGAQPQINSFVMKDEFTSVKIVPKEHVCKVNE